MSEVERLDGWRGYVVLHLLIKSCRQDFNRTRICNLLFYKSMPFCLGPSWKIIVIKDKAIEEISEKSTRPGSLSRLAALRVTLSKKKHKQPVFSYGLGDCVHQVSFLYRFSFGRRSRTNRQTPVQVKIGISSTGCSPDEDFKNI